MPGIAYCFIALDRTIQSLKSENADAQAIAALLLEPDNSAFAKLGALGPILRDHTPLTPQEFEIWQETADVAATLQTDGLAAFDTESAEDQDTFRRIMRLQRRITMVGFTSLFDMVRTTWPLLDRGFALMDDLEQIVKDKDLGALRDKQGEIEAFRALVDGNDGEDDGGSAFDFEDQFALLNELNIRARPPIMSEQSGNASLTDTFGLTTPGFWRESDLMRWRASGTFVQALLANATTDRQRAYAYGYMIHIAACVTGQPFLNAIAGGPARSHWWRHRLISHHVDSWAHGYYAANAQMQGDTASPPYADWPDLCAAQLHDQIDLGLGPTGMDLLDVVLGSAQDGTPVPLPDNAALSELVDLLSQTATQVYVDSNAYQGLADVIGFDTAHDFSADAFRRAYFGLSAVLWLQTSGEGPTCPRPFTATPPDDCFDTPPSWVETNEQPPDPQGNKGATAAAIILAILAFLLSLAGGLGAGLAALAGAIGATVVATDDFWDSVRCMLYWQRYSLAQIENRVSAFLVLGTLVPPPASKLAGIHPENGMDGPVLDQSDRPLTRTTIPDPDYPRQMDRGGATAEAASYAPDLGYMSYPTAAGAEEPLQLIWPSIGANRYANFAMDGDGMWPLLNGGIMSAASFPANVGANGQPLWLGNTVENAVQIVQAGAGGLANYNLDADRGYGWVEWEIPLLNLASNPPINAKNPG